MALLICRANRSPGTGSPIARVARGRAPVITVICRCVPLLSHRELLLNLDQKNLAMLAMLDAHLAARDYVTGPAFTMADIPLGVTAYRWFNLEIERPPMPNLEAWYERLCARSPYKASVMLPLS